MDTQLRQQPISDERPDNADNQVADEAVAATPHDIASQPPGNNADDNDDDETFVREVHWGFLRGILCLAETCSMCAAYIIPAPRPIRHSLLLVAAIGFDATGTNIRSASSRVGVQPRAV